MSLESNAEQPLGMAGLGMAGFALLATAVAGGTGDNARPHGGESRCGRQARASGRYSVLVMD